jgi:hypothetical protein
MSKLEVQQKYRSNSPRYSMYQTLRHAKARAEVTITIQDLMDIFETQEGKCALSGVKMTWHQGKIQPTSISIDRIDNSKGYIPGNVRLVCVVVNAFKSTQTDSELYEFAKQLVENMAKTQPN